MRVRLLAITRKVQGAEDSYTMACMSHLASTYTGQGRSKEAEELRLAVLKMIRRVSGALHQDTLNVMSILAV